MDTSIKMGIGGGKMKAKKLNLDLFDFVLIILLSIFVLITVQSLVLMFHQNQKRIEACQSICTEKGYEYLGWSCFINNPLTGCKYIECYCYKVKNTRKYERTFAINTSEVEEE